GIVDVTDNTSIPEKELEDIIAENTLKDIIIKTSFDVSFIFDKGTMEKVEGKDRYDFGVTITTDYGEVDSKPKHHFHEDEMISYVHFFYSGKLPGSPWIKIPVGMKWAGQTLFYYYYNEAEEKLEFVYSAKVDTDGYLVVKQTHCSDYVILSKEAATADEGIAQQPEGDEEDENEVATQTAASPKTADNRADMRLLVVLMVVSLCAVVVTGRKKEI
ncbi:MAG: hypothetical protein NC086_08110, partial [Alistipes sp.]|nr:hypothetical protein [Alistipes sp.]